MIFAKSDHLSSLIRSTVTTRGCAMHGIKDWAVDGVNCGHIMHLYVMSRRYTSRGQACHWRVSSLNPAIDQRAIIAIVCSISHLFHLQPPSLCDCQNALFKAYTMKHLSAHKLGLLAFCPRLDPTQAGPSQVSSCDGFTKIYL